MLVRAAVLIVALAAGHAIAQPSPTLPPIADPILHRFLYDQAVEIQRLKAQQAELSERLEQAEKALVAHEQMLSRR